MLELLNDSVFFVLQLVTNISLLILVPLFSIGLVIALINLIKTLIQDIL